ncbi:hypothetical protein C8J56DRAFT_1040021 [Mycena floridula]|nr:hypothetical protein C8J56DRAFT_1040021 [Mycena floridula]
MSLINGLPNIHVTVHIHQHPTSPSLLNAAVSQYDSSDESESDMATSDASPCDDEMKTEPSDIVIPNRELSLFHAANNYFTIVDLPGLVSPAALVETQRQGLHPTANFISLDPNVCLSGICFRILPNCPLLADPGANQALENKWYTVISGLWISVFDDHSAAFNVTQGISGRCYCSYKELSPALASFNTAFTEGHLNIIQRK